MPCQLLHPGYATDYDYPAYPPPSLPSAYPSQTMTGASVRLESASRGNVSGGPAGYSGVFTSKEPVEVNNLCT